MNQISKIISHNYNFNSFIPEIKKNKIIIAVSAVALTVFALIVYYLRRSSKQRTPAEQDWITPTQPTVTEIKTIAEIEPSLFEPPVPFRNSIVGWTQSITPDGLKTLNQLFRNPPYRLRNLSYLVTNLTGHNIYPNKEVMTHPIMAYRTSDDQPAIAIKVNHKYNPYYHNGGVRAQALVKKHTVQTMIILEQSRSYKENNDYVWRCVIPDTQSTQPHFLNGEFTSAATGIEPTENNQDGFKRLKQLLRKGRCTDLNNNTWTIPGVVPSKPKRKRKEENPGSFIVNQ